MEDDPHIGEFGRQVLVLPGQRLAFMGGGSPEGEGGAAFVERGFGRFAPRLAEQGVLVGDGGAFSQAAYFVEEQGV